MVVRHEVNVEAIGQAAQLPEDLSPLQIGTHGEIDGQGFILIGRVRIAYDEGSWNEWCALFGDNRYGWVAEAQGFFMVSFEFTPPDDFAKSPGELLPGASWTIQNQTYTVADSKQSTCLGCEGELPFQATPNRKATSVDLSGVDSRFASMEFSDAGIRLFVGRYARFDDLKFSDLRLVPGWSDNAPEPERKDASSLKCPHCGATVVLRAAGLTMSATCGSCGSLIDTATPDLALIRRAQERQRITPAIPIGRRGQLFGVNYEVIGFQHVKDEGSGWVEYLMFNPWQGFAWLVTYNGHWSFVRRLYEQPAVEAGFLSEKAIHASFGGETYHIFAQSSVVTDYVVGEFYWKVSVGMSTQVSDFISPPRILSRETYPDLTEQTWSLGEYMAPAVLEHAFGLEEHLRDPVGTYLNQPNPYLEKSRQLKWLVPVVVLILLLVQILSAHNAAHQPVFAASYNYHPGLSNAPVVTEPFEVKGGVQALEYELSAPVDNNWLELELDLVNANTHQVADSHEQDIEFYHGYDEGYWSEGKRTTRVLVPAVAPGKYYLTLESSADPAVRAMPFSVKIVRDVVVWSNFWIALVLVLLYPIYCWMRSYTFERARWLESDYAPSIYAQSGSDD
jgi:hypothetical protein